MVPAVYVPQFDGKLDISDAARFGEVRVLFNRDLYPDDAEDRMPRVVEHVRRQLGEFDPEIDYLCLVGSPIYQAVCFRVLGEVLPAGQPIRALRFDRIERAYYDLTIT